MRGFRWLTPLAIVAVAACAESADETTPEAGMEPAAEAPAETAPAAEMALACAPTATGEELAGRASPYDSTTIDVGEGAAKVCYSRPQLRDRTMIGGDAVPYGELWRFGANEPTIIHLDVAASIAGAQVEPGSYSLYAIPREGEDWTLIVNRSTSQWGHEGQYTAEVEAEEVARVTVETEAIEEPVESFTIRAADDGSGLVAEWQNSRVHIPVTPAG